jgi:uncharacterized membrane protein
MRAMAWLGIAALVVLAYRFDSDGLRLACAAGVLAALAFFAPRSLRASLAVVIALASALLALSGVAGLLAALPALLAAFVGWLFARTLWRGRTPLIARAIAAIDGAGQLADPAVIRYARTLTVVWACYQFALAALGAALALRAWPAPELRMFGAVWLPLAIMALFVGEFALRPLLLPQAPRHALLDFVRRLIGVWPQLLD